MPVAVAVVRAEQSRVILMPRNQWMGPVGGGVAIVELAFVFGYELRQAAGEGAVVDVDGKNEDVFVNFGNKDTWVR